MNKEIWKDIIGYEGLYQVSNMGRVKSLNYNHTGTERVLKAIKGKYGYLKVNLYKDGKKKPHYVHRIVAQTFIPNPNNLSEVNHMDERPENNMAENLEWVSHKENINYGTRTERALKLQINHPSKSKPVLQYTPKGELVREWSSAREAGRNGFHQGGISQCCNGKYGCNTHKGYVWKFKN